MGGSVLCVDDDRNLCQILAKALGAEGYQVLTAHDGEQALALARESEPDLVLLDLLLPKRDGFEVLAALRAEPGALRDVPVLLITGCSPTPEYRERATSLGVTALLQKPVPLAALLARTAEAVRKGHAGEGGRDRADGPPAVAGSLARVPFPALLHHLHGLRATGVVQLTSGRKQKWIELRDGHPVAVRSNLVNECLGNFLVRTGRLSHAEVVESRRRMKSGRRQGEILVAMDLLTEEEVTAALRAQADEKLFELFSWDKGSFRFERNARLERANALGVGRTPANLILEGVRRRFSGERIAAFMREHAELRPAPAESPYYRFQDVELSPRQQVLLSSLDGRRALKDILSSEPALGRTLYALCAMGLIELLGATAAARAPSFGWTSPPGEGAEEAPARALPPPRQGDPPARPAVPPVPPVSSRVHLGAPAPPADEERRRRELATMAERFQGLDHFQVLGLEPNASDLEIRASYSRLAERTHPDRYAKYGDAVKRLAAQVFARATDAYETISDPGRRAEYFIERAQDERAPVQLSEDENALRAEREFQRGERLLRDRAYEEALVRLGRALELYPEEGEYHAHYGWALHLCHPADPSIAEEAIEHVKRGLKLASHREKPYLFLGRLYRAIGRVGQAERMFARAVQISPDCHEALRELRLMDMRRGKRRGLIGRLLRR